MNIASKLKIAAILIAGVVPVALAVFRLENPTKPAEVRVERLANTMTAAQIVKQTKLPKQDVEIKRTNKKVGNYQIGVAETGNSNQAVELTTAKGNIGITTLDNRDLGVVNPSQAQVKGTQTVYKNIYSGVDLIYTASKDKVLEEYEVKTPKTVTEIVQKLDISGLNYQKQVDGSILLFKKDTGEFAFAIPRPVMYERGDARQRSYGLHYEILEQNGLTYLVKVIDAKGQDWLKKSNYPVVIDATILLTLFSYESYPIVDGKWQIRLETVGQGDLTISPGIGGTTLTCGGNLIPLENTSAGLIARNFSCSDLALVTVQPGTALTFTYGNYSTTVESPSLSGKPVFLSASVTPPTPKVGDILTIKAEISDDAGISRVFATLGNDQGPVEVVLNLVSGTATHGTYQGSWKVENTVFKQYPALITATNTKSLSSRSQLAFFDAYTCLGGGDHGAATWDPSTDCPGGIAGVHTNITTLTVSGTATVQAYNGSAYGSVSISAVTVTISGTLTANGKGYSGGGVNTGGSGSGGGSSNGYGGGGGHGGRGNTNNGASGGGTYGSMLTPITFGSGAGGSWAGGGGNGGGAISITATGTMTVSGTVTSGGLNGANDAGGGAGGSIYLTAATLNGSGGTITANGGNAGSANGGGGGGGRIAVKYSSSYTAPTTLTAQLGSYGTGGENGTLVVIDTTNNDLYLNTSQTWRADSTLEGQNFSYRNVTISNSSTLTLVGYYTTNTNGVGQTFAVTNFTLGAGSTIAANSRGYAGGGQNTNGSGSGGGTSSGNGGGGGYGGAGGTVGAASGGATYGSATAPIDLGSGGAGSWPSNSLTGGAGGGAVKISASGTLTLAGTISINGNSGGAQDSGGGSGGSVYLISPTLNASGGTITANGGNGNGNGGGGGGGRIALYYATSYTAPTTLTATKGTGGTGTADGIVNVYQKNIPVLTTLSQYQSDCTTAIGTGGNMNGNGCLGATITDADNPDTEKLEFEYQPVGTTFTNISAATITGIAMAGSPVSRTQALSGLTMGTSYHWQAKVTDSFGFTSGWVSYPVVSPNSESAADFITLLPPPTNVSSSYVSDSSITVSWTNNAGGYADTNYIERSVNGATYSQIATTSASIATYSDTTTAASNKYNYRVRAGQSGSYSSYATATYPTYTSPGFGKGTYLTKLGRLFVRSDAMQKVDVWKNVQNDTADKTSEDLSYSATSPASGPVFPSAPTFQSLTVSEGVSLVDNKSDVVYVGTNNGLVAIHENAITPASGAVKYYTKDYITELMVGDVRGMWPLDSRYGSGLSDASSKVQTLTNNGVATFTGGVRGEAVSLNGTTQFLSIADNANLSVTGNLSFGGWFKTTSVSTAQDIVAKNGSYNISLTAAGKLQAQIIGATTGTQLGSTTVNTNWHQVVAVYNASAQTLNLYLDGKLDNGTLTGTVPTAITDSTGPFDIGADNGATFFSGNIDEVFVTATALSGGQIAPIYESGYHALQNHTGSNITGITGANDYQKLLGGGTVGATVNKVTAVGVDSRNQFVYAGTNDATGNTGGVSVIGILSDTVTDLYSTINTAKKDDQNTAFSANDAVALSVSGAPNPAYRAETDANNSGGAISIVGTNDTATRVWIEGQSISLTDALAGNGNKGFSGDVLRVTSPLGSPTFPNGEAQLTPAFQINQAGVLSQNYLGTDTTATAFTLTDATLTTGTLMSLSSTGNKVLNLVQTGVTGTAYGAYINNTGAATTNVALYTSATGATNNYAAVFASGNVGIGTTTPTALLQVFGNSTTQVASISASTGKAALLVDNTIGDLFTASSSGLNRFVITQNGNVGIGTTGPNSLLQVVGVASVAGQLSLYTTPTIQSLANQSLVIGGNTTGNIQLTPNNTATLLVGPNSLTQTGNATISGTLGVGGNTTLQGDLAVKGNTSFTGVINAGTWQGTAIGAIYGGTGQTTVTTGDLLYGSSTNTWSKLADVATGNVLISGGISTAPSWGKVVLGTHTTGNYVSQVIGTINQITASAATGDVTLTIPSDFRAPGTVNAVTGLYTGAGAGTNRIDVSGNLVNIGNITATGTLSNTGNATISGTLGVGGNASMSAFLTLDAAVAKIGSTNMRDLILGGTETGGVYLSPKNTTGLYVNGAGNVGIGTTSPLAKLQVFNSSNTQTASISATNSLAALLVDNTVGDLFTASSSGLNRFVITQNGNVGIGTTIPGTNLEVRRLGATAGGINVTTDQGGSYLSLSPISNGLALPSVQSYGAQLALNAVGNDVQIGATGTYPYQTGFYYVSSSHRVGIGTTGPAAKLEVRSWNETPYAIYVDAYNSGGASEYGVYSYAHSATTNVGGYFSAAGGTNNYAGIFDQGSVGIGTTGPTALLQVFGNSTTQVASISASTGKAALLVDNTIGDIFTASSSGLNRFVITQNGNVGIGTTVPGGKLTVAGAGTGTMFVGDPACGGNFTAAWFNNSPGGCNNYNIMSSPTDYNLYINAGNSSSIFFRRGNGDTMMIDSTGNVGIGTTGPRARLDVVSSQTSTASAFIENSTTTAASDGLIIKMGATAIDATTHFIRLLNNAGQTIGTAKGASQTTMTWQGNGIDLAEYMTVAGASLTNGQVNLALFPEGTVLCQGADGVEPCTATQSAQIAGVVSVAPSFLGGVERSNAVMVGLVGQLKVKIASDSAAVKAGDMITVADHGQGKKITSRGYTVGKAVTEGAPGSLVLVLFQPGYYEGDALSLASKWSVDQLQSQIASLSALSSLGSLSDLNLATLSAELALLRSNFGATDGQATISGNLTVLGKTQLADTSIGGSLQVGLLHFDDLKGEISAITGQVTINSNLSVMGDATVSGQLKAKIVETDAINLKDVVTGEYYCVRINNGDFSKVKGECQ